MSDRLNASRRGGNAPEPKALDGTGRRRQAKPYVPPRLEYFGKLSELTRFGGSRVVDSGPMSLGNQPPP